MSLHEGFDSNAEALKIRHRQLFLNIQRASRAWPGGVTEGFKVMGIHPNSALPSFAPDCYDKAPSLLLALEYISYFKPRAVVHYIAGLADCITVPAPSTRKVFPSRKAAADDLAVSLRRVLYAMDDAASSPSTSRAQAIQSDLLALIDAAHAMYIKLSPVAQDVRAQSPSPVIKSQAFKTAAVHSADEHQGHASPVQGSSLDPMHAGARELDVSVGSEVGNE